MIKKRHIFSMVCTRCTCFTDVFALFLFRNISKVFCNLHSFKQICLATPVVLFLLHVFLLQTLNCLVLLGTTREEKIFQLRWSVHDTNNNKRFIIVISS